MFVAIAIIASVILVGIDQFLKLLAVEHLSSGEYFTVIEGVLRFRYVENTGAVFGSFSSHTAVLTVVSIILLGVTIYFLISQKNTNKIK